MRSGIPWDGAGGTTVANAASMGTARPCRMPMTKRTNRLLVFLSGKNGVTSTIRNPANTCILSITKLPGSNRNWTFTNKTGQTTLQTHYSPKSRLLDRPSCSSPPRGKHLLQANFSALAESGGLANHV